MNFFSPVIYQKIYGFFIISGGVEVFFIYLKSLNIRGKVLAQLVNIS